MSDRAVMVIGGLITAAFTAALWAIAMFWIGTATVPDCSDPNIIKSLCEPDWFARRVMAFMTGLPVTCLAGLAGARLTAWVMKGPSA